MNLNKHLEFLEPAKYNKQIHIIGVGAVGSRIGEQIARLGFDNVVIYDFDTVEDVNIPNQLFIQEDIGKSKVDAMEKHLLGINPRMKIRKMPKGFHGQPLSGTVFLAVDSIDLRRSIVSDNLHNNNIDIMFDGRMRLTDAQYYGAVWSSVAQREILLDSMQFTDADAEKATPVSACGSSLSVVPTVVCLASFAVSNFINFLKGEDVVNMAFIDPFKGFVDANVYK